MKVKFATQTLSSSVADAIEFLKLSGVPAFQNSDATVLFVRKLDRIFDFLNSRSPFNKGFKKPIYSYNLQFYKEEAENWIQYLYQLQDANGTPLHLSKRKTFVIGFVTAIRSVLFVSEKLLAKHYYKYVLTFKFSQDHLEIFFSILRSRWGFNNNPNCVQVIVAIKKLLLKNDVAAPSTGNCAPLTEIENDDENELEDLLDVNCDDRNVYFKDSVLYYISGYIVRKLLKKIKCNSCRLALVDKTNPEEHSYARTIDIFTKLKNRGGLYFASADVFKIVTKTNGYVNVYLGNCRNRIETFRLINKVVYDIANHCDIFKNLKCDNEDIDDNHKLTLIKLVGNLFVKIRMHSLAKNLNNDIISKRRKFTKIILLSNQ